MKTIFSRIWLPCLAGLSMTLWFTGCERHDWEKTQVLFEEHGEPHHGEGHDGHEGEAGGDHGKEDGHHGGEEDHGKADYHGKEGGHAAEDGNHHDGEAPKEEGGRKVFAD